MTASMSLELITGQPLNGYNGTAARYKFEFHKVGKRQLGRLARALNLTADRYEVRSNRGGAAVSGEVTLHADCIYIQISQSMGQGNEVLFRACDGMQDYTGKQNHFAPASVLDDPESFADYLRDCNRFGL